MRTRSIHRQLGDQFSQSLGLKLLKQSRNVFLLGAFLTLSFTGCSDPIQLQSVAGSGTADSGTINWSKVPAGSIPCTAMAGGCVPSSIPATNITGWNSSSLAIPAARITNWGGTCSSITSACSFATTSTSASGVTYTALGSAASITAQTNYAATPTSTTPVPPGSPALTINALSASSAGFKSLASIDFKADGNVTSTSAPGAISLNTTPNSSTSPTPRVIVESDGTVTIPGQLNLVPPGGGRYNSIKMTGGNQLGFLYGAFYGSNLGDGLHLGYNYYNDGVTASSVAAPATTSDHVGTYWGGTSRVSVGYGQIRLATAPAQCSASPCANPFPIPSVSALPVDRVLVDSSQVELKVPLKFQDGTLQQTAATTSSYIFLIDWSTNNKTTKAGFTAVTPYYSGKWASGGDLYLTGGTPQPQSALFEMKIRNPTSASIQITQFVSWVDDHVYFYISGGAGAAVSPASRLNSSTGAVTWTFAPGDNTIDIIWNNGGGGTGGLVLMGDFFSQNTAGNVPSGLVFVPQGRSFAP